MGSRLLNDGRWEHTFRQSFLGNFVHCPEQARQSYMDLLPHTHNDATALGTAFHAAAEYACHELALHDQPDPTILDPDQMVDVGQQELATIGEWETIRLTRDQMDSALNVMVGAWLTDHAPTVAENRPHHMERTFKFTVHEDDERVIRISGTMDMEDSTNIVWDWKTSSSVRGYTSDAWEKRRWAVQPTVYLKALSLLNDGLQWEDMRFRYAAVDYTGKTAQLDIERHEGHWQFLLGQMFQIAQLIERDVNPWPLNDAGWWCSPKWCDLWSSCKGKHISDW